MGGHLVGGHGWVDPALSNWIQLASPRPWCSGPAGRSSCAAGSRWSPQPQHVHADRDGHRRRLGLQRRRDARARDLPGRLPRPRRRAASTSRRRRSSPRSCCSARCSSSARARRDRRRDPALLELAPKTARADRRGRHRGGRIPLAEVASAIACACGPARRCRSTASSSKAAASSTNRW